LLRSFRGTPEKNPTSGHSDGEALSPELTPIEMLELDRLRKVAAI
jgi:hypothetical protein